MWVAAERPPRTRAARLFVFSRTCVIISKPVTPCKTFRGNMAEFFNRLLGSFRLSKPECFSRGDHLGALAPGPGRRRLNNACRWSKGAGSQAHWFFERFFPLTPALSPR